DAFAENDPVRAFAEKLINRVVAAGGVGAGIAEVDAVNIVSFAAVHGVPTGTADECVVSAVTTKIVIAAMAFENIPARVEAVEVFIGACARTRHRALQVDGGIVGEIHALQVIGHLREDGAESIFLPVGALVLALTGALQRRRAVALHPGMHLLVVHGDAGD